MNKSILWLIGLLFATSFAIVSCSESDGVEDPYANWEERNQKYIDSIAAVAKGHLGNNVGDWKMIRSYKLPPLGLNEVGEVNDYVYCKILEKGEGVMPLFTDTVAVNYRGKLINGTVFDQSYQGTLDPDIAVPATFTPKGVIVGWSSALMQMKVGDRWEIYFPYNLGYGEEGSSSSIPGYSTLIFDINLVDVYPLKGNGKSVVDGINAE